MNRPPSATRPQEAPEVAVHITLTPGWNLISLPFQPPNPAINAVIPATHPIDVVMTYSDIIRNWLVARRTGEEGLFMGDLQIVTAMTAYFLRADRTVDLVVMRSPITTPAAAPAQPLTIPVHQGWNLVPILTNDLPIPRVIPADKYFVTLGNEGWAKALTFDPTTSQWESVTPKSRGVVKVGKGYWLFATKSGVIIPY